MVNDEFCALLDRPRSSLLGLSIDAITMPEDLDRSRGALEKAAAGDEHSKLVQRCLKPDGTILWAECVFARIPDAEGRTASVVAAAIDVGDRRKTTEALRAAQERNDALSIQHRAEAQARRESEERLRFALEAAEMGTWWWEPLRDVTVHDERALEILGLEPGTELTFADALEQHLQPENAEAYQEGLRRIRDPKGGGRFQLELKWRRPKGDWIWVQMTGQAHFEDEGEDRCLKWLTGTVVDISERKRNEEAIEEASRQKDRFLATLAHELRNPLAPLSYAAELLQEDGEQQIDWARGVIDRQLKHLTRLIDDLLDLSRITRDRLEVRREQIPIGEVVQAAVEASKPTLRRTAQELEVGLPLEPVHVCGDFVRLTQVLTNLLKNAAKFSAGPGRVWLTVERRNGTVSICVRDSGIGIPPDEVPRLFDMFYQSDLSIGKTHGGLGIGLYLVRRIVEMHDGTVEARSKGERQGSEFIVRLPAMEVGAADAPTFTAGDGAVQREVSRRVLVVDDNRDCADTLAKLMRVRGNEAETAYDGAMALEAAERMRPDVVLLDLGMPRLDGYRVCRRIRERPWGVDVRIVALTGWGRAEDRARSREAGFDDHLVKPVSLAAIDSLLRRYRESR